MLDQYKKVAEINISKASRKTTHGQKARFCRFCKKSHPKVSFNDDAHNIPKSLGNRFLLSNHECDNCNKLFGKYDKTWQNI
ncbi:MAG: histidinol phosphatase-like PHP family hydrolase [Halioglobus sp.]|jgi:histidinol phosphatase-like PHP family hydrolase